MTLHRIFVLFRYRVHHSRLLQIATLFAFWLLGEWFVRLAGLPVPGGIIGLVVVLALLLSGRISLYSMKRGADWFIAEMLLFFIPAVLAVLDHREFIGLLGLKVMTVILVGTLTVMSVTALTVDLFYRWTMRHVDK